MWFRQWWAISKVHHFRIKRTTTIDKNISLHHRKKYFSFNNTQNCKKTEKWNHPYRGDRKKTSWNNIKAKKIHNIDIKAYQKYMEESCKNSLNCNNCKGNHRADSKYCKIWEREKEINKMKIAKNITFPEARRLIENPFNKLTFLQVTRTPSNQFENEAKTQIKTKKIEELTNLINDLHELIKTLKTMIPMYN